VLSLVPAVTLGKNISCAEFATADETGPDFPGTALSRTYSTH
jgi:hypothetical protein